MNTKTKTLIIFLLTLTLIIIMGDVYYHYKLVVATNPTKGTFWYQFFVDESQQNIEIAPNYYENLPLKTSKIDRISKFNKTKKVNKTRSRTSDSEASWSGLDINFGESNLLKHSFNQRQSISSSYLGSGYYAYKNNRKEDRLYGTLSSGLAYGNYTLRSFGGTISDDNITSRNWAINGPLAVPFSNGYTGTPSTTGGTILFDPGARYIPVGEGWWMLLLLAIAYMEIKRMRQRFSLRDIR